MRSSAARETSCTTSVLGERFVRSVLEDGIAVEAILTITFTEKAAAEMRDRIRARLRELAADEAAAAPEAPRLLAPRPARARARGGDRPAVRCARRARGGPHRRRRLRRGARGYGPERTRGGRPDRVLHPRGS